MTNPDDELHRRWRELRNNGSVGAMSAMREVISFARAIGALTDDQAELWSRRIETCPGHGDEGGRSWCAYCGDLKPDEDDAPESGAPHV